MGIISKKILDRVNSKVRATTNVNQFRNTQAAIDWFRGIRDKPSHQFIVFDIESFYPSITEDLLARSLDYASQFDTITDDERDIIMHARKSFLFSSNKAWIKQNPADPDSSDSFDVTMGSYDGAEICDLVGLYLLSDLSNHFGNQIALYRDDGIAAIKASNKEVENAKKKICSIFRNHNLKITIEANKKVVNYLDVTFNLNNSTFQPYTKPGHTITYVHRLSNHPPSVIKNIPEAVNRRLSSIASNEDVFKKAVPPYQEAIDKSGYSYKLSYNPTPNRTPRPRNRQRKIIWFNPPFSSNVSTDIGRRFLKIISESFPRGSKLFKIFNRNTVKLSYSCMPSIGSIIKSHNRKIISNSCPTMRPTFGCNCNEPANCPLPGECTTPNVVYQATITHANDQEGKTYVGCTNTSFKTRYRNHMSDFNLAHRKGTELSKYYRQLKREGITPIVRWSILSKADPYSNVNRRCNLCIEERFIIRFRPQMASLNKKDDLVSSCRHKKTFLISPS